MYSYGFTYMDNKYDSFAFKVKITLTLERELEHISELLEDPNSEEYHVLGEEIRLKMDQLNLSKVLLINVVYSLTWVHEDNFQDCV